MAASTTIGNGVATTLPERMSDGHGVDLAALLDSPARAVEVPAAEVPAVLAAVAAQEAALGTVRSILAARLVIPGGPHSGNGTAGKPYTLIEAAGLLDKSTAWLRRKAKAGHVPGAQKVGRSWMFEPAAFDRWCRRSEVG
jgi:hypothetical protein